jgi:DNA invertase Pin-like site-specific DNA recombinase
MPPVGQRIVTIIGGIAEFERELIRARTGDGIQRAKAAGVRMGDRPS